MPQKQNVGVKRKWKDMHKKKVSYFVNRTRKIKRKNKRIKGDKYEIRREATKER